jgi:hypothetical protein
LALVHLVFLSRVRCEYVPERTSADVSRAAASWNPGIDGDVVSDRDRDLEEHAARGWHPTVAAGRPALAGSGVGIAGADSRGMDQALTAVHHKFESNPRQQLCRGFFMRTAQV